MALEAINTLRKGLCLFTVVRGASEARFLGLNIVQLLMVLVTVSCLSAQEAISLKEAFPVTETLRDFELRGAVRQAITDIPYKWDSEAKRFRPYGDGTIEVFEFNREGYLTAHRYGSQENGPLEIVSSYEYSLDEKNRVRQFRKIDNWNSRVIVSVEYEYVLGEDFIDIKPARVEVPEDEYWAYKSYREVFSGGRKKELLIYWHDLSTAPASYLAWRYLFTAGELSLVQQWNPDEFLSEQHYVNGRKVLQRGGGGPPIKETRYSYQGEDPWPSSELRQYMDGDVIQYVFEYTLDNGGNWVEQRRFQVINGEKQPSHIHRREIEYY